MYVFPSMLRSAEAMLQARAPAVAFMTTGWQYGIKAGEGSAVSVLNQPTASPGSFVPRGTMSLSHIECGRCSQVTISETAYTACWCKLGNFARVYLRGALEHATESPPSFFVRGKDCCSIIMGVTSGGANKQKFPKLGFVGGSFSLSLELSYWSNHFSLRVLDDTPVTIYADGQELPVKVTKEMRDFGTYIPMETSPYDKLKKDLYMKLKKTQVWEDAVEVMEGLSEHRDRCKA